MQKHQLSKKSQEVVAEQCIKVSTNLFTAFWVAILIVPISAIVGNAFSPSASDLSAWDAFLNLFASWYGALFLVLELILYKLTLKLRKEALLTYNELYPDKKIDVSSDSSELGICTNN